MEKTQASRWVLLLAVVGVVGCDAAVDESLEPPPAGLAPKGDDSLSCHPALPVGDIVAYDRLPEKGSLGEVVAVLKAGVRIYECGTEEVQTTHGEKQTWSLISYWLGEERGWGTGWTLDAEVCTDNSLTLDTTLYDDIPFFSASDGWVYPEEIGSLSAGTPVGICTMVMPSNGSEFLDKTWFLISYGDPSAPQTAWTPTSGG